MYKLKIATLLMALLIVTYGYSRHSVANLFFKNETIDLSSLTIINNQNATNPAQLTNLVGNIKNILAPLPWQVNQRSNSNSSRFRISLDLTSDVEATNFLRLTVMTSDNEQILPTTNLKSTDCPQSSPPHIECTSPEIRAGGWYIFKIETLSATGVVLGVATVSNIGVGEIFITAGQSNSVASGELLTGIAAPQFTSVAAVRANGTQWKQAGEPMPFSDGYFNGLDVPNVPQASTVWPSLGQKLSVELGVPIAFVVTGCGATSIGEWQPNPNYKENHTNGASCANGTGFTNLFERLAKVATTLTSENGGFRAILWDQGEDDTILNTPSAEYFEQFKNLKLTLDQRLPQPAIWMVAHGSFVPNELWQSFLDGKSMSPNTICLPYELNSNLLLWNNMQSIRLAQEKIWEQKLALPGPDIDSLNGPYRWGSASGVCIHFSALGITAVATSWFNSMSPYFQILKNKNIETSSNLKFNLTEIFVVNSQQFGKTATISTDFIIDHFNSELNPANTVYNQLTLFQTPQYINAQFKFYLVSKNNFGANNSPDLGAVYLNKNGNQYLSSFEPDNNPITTLPSNGEKFLLGYAARDNYKNTQDAKYIEQSILNASFAGARFVYSVKIRQCQFANGSISDVIPNPENLLQNTGANSEYTYFCDATKNDSLLAGGYWTVLVCANNNCSGSSLYGW